MSNRGEEWEDFSGVVEMHIENYTVKQYGDSPDDQVEGWTAGECMKAISKYANRFATQRRGRLETLRDLVKIAHFACIAYQKLQPSGEEQMKVEEGIT
jgi:hypothetical protein